MTFLNFAAYSFTHVKVWKSIVNLKILEFEADIGIILNDFQSWFWLNIEIRLSFPDRQADHGFNDFDQSSGWARVSAIEAESCLGFMQPP